jgi:Ca2+:H+ antiporter
MDPANNISEEDEGRPFLAYARRSSLDAALAEEIGVNVSLSTDWLGKRSRMFLSVLMLALSAALASLCADNLVSAVEHVLSHTHLTETFLGLVLFPLLGNTTELGTAIAVAMSNQIDLAINVSIGSAAQIALFMTPVLVIIAWISQGALSLVFRPFETFALVIAMVLITLIMIGTSGHYSGGVVLCVCYAALW